MKKIESIEELKEIQLNILLSLNQFCEDNNIKYSLAAGSLIGAVRHQGFIPWDDDIDVYLMRDEYNKLSTSFPKVYQEKYSLVTIERNNKWYRSSGKLFDIRTLEYEESRLHFDGLGVGIDIFPIDDVPDDILKWRKYEKKRRFLRNVMIMKTMTFSKNRPLLKNILMYWGRLILCPFTFAMLAKLMDNYAQLNNGKGYHHVYENCLGLYNSKHPWLKEDLAEVKDALFEGHSVKVMKGYDDYLSTVYGEYMKLPPVEKRKSTHTFTAWWK